MLFKDRGSASIVGESSVFYLFSKAAAKEIYDYNPEAKIIIMFERTRCLSLLASLTGIVFW